MHAASPAYCAPCVRHTNLPQTRLRHAPGARRAGRTLAAAAEPPSRVSELLGGTSIFIVGDNTTANQEVATALAARLGYAPVDTAGVIQQLAGQTFAAIAEAEGADSSALAEAQIIEQLCTVGRVVVSTYGGGLGAAARGACWQHMFGGITVWLDEDGSPSAPQRDAYALSEVTVKATSLQSLPCADLTVRVLAGIEAVLLADAKLVGKKSLYIRLGARGDWPDLAPPSGSG